VIAAWPEFFLGIPIYQTQFKILIGNSMRNGFHLGIRQSYTEPFDHSHWKKSVRIPSKLMLVSLPLLFAGGFSGLYFLKMLSVLAFVSGAIGFLWQCIERCCEEGEFPE